MKITTSFILFLFSFSAANAQGYKVTLQTPNYKSGLAYLTYYYGKNMNVQDSAIVNSKGVAIFEGKEKMPPGVYSIVKFQLAGNESHTQLVFDHTGFPTGNAYHLAPGWKSHYWEPLKKYLA